MSPVKGWKSTAPAPPPRLSASSTTATNRTSEQLLELHRLAHVALDLELAGHVRGGRVLLALRDLHERLARGGDGGVGLVAVLADADVAVVHVDGPGACPVDLESIGGGEPTGFRRIDARLQR